jgi:ankyrin repeat protein
MQTTRALDKNPQLVERLCTSAKDGDVNEVTRLLEQGVDPDCAGKNGSTAMVMAADKGHAAVVKALLDGGANPTIGKGEKTPMIAAFQKGHKEILSLLFAASFQTLESAVGSGGSMSPVARAHSANLGGGDDEVPYSSICELRDVTARLASISQKPPETGWVSTVSMAPQADSDLGDSDLARENAMRMAMRNCAQAKKQADTH